MCDLVLPCKHVSDIRTHDSDKGIYPSNCIGRKELSHVHIKPHAMTRAMTFGKVLPESEVVY